MLPDAAARSTFEPMPHTRLFALVGVPEGERKAAHTAGYPLDPSQMLPLADVVLLVADAEPGAMVFRYTTEGETAGDTWHPSVDAAQQQLLDEYGEALAPWFRVADDVEDAHAFVIRYAAEQLNGR
jgi:hypothetical protein